MYPRSCYLFCYKGSHRFNVILKIKHTGKCTTCSGWKFRRGHRSEAFLQIKFIINKWTAWYIISFKNNYIYLLICR